LPSPQNLKNWREFEGVAFEAFALVVDAKDDGAVSFYEHHGFRRFASKPQSLFLPLGTSKKGAAK